MNNMFQEISPEMFTKYKTKYSRIIKRKEYSLWPFSSIFKKRLRNKNERLKKYAKEIYYSFLPKYLRNINEIFQEISPEISQEIFLKK